MTSEYDSNGEVQPVFFRADEIKALADNARLFHFKFENKLTSDELLVDKNGNTIRAKAGDMPTFTNADGRSVTVVAGTHMFPASYSVTLRDRIGSSISDRIAITRQLCFSPERIDSDEYRERLQVHYMEFPVREDGSVVPHDARTNEMPKQSMYYRPLTQGDYADMMQALSAGLEAWS